MHCTAHCTLHCTAVKNKTTQLSTHNTQHTHAPIAEGVEGQDPGGRLFVYNPVAAGGLAVVADRRCGAPEEGEHRHREPEQDNADHHPEAHDFLEHPEEDLVWFGLVRFAMREGTGNEANTHTVH